MTDILGLSLYYTIIYPSEDEFHQQSVDIYKSAELLPPSLCLFSITNVLIIYLKFLFWLHRIFIDSEFVYEIHVATFI